MEFSASSMYTAEYFISKLGLEPHPEGGYFSQIYKSDWQVADEHLPVAYGSERSLYSTIYFLLCAGQVSHFHRLRSDEVMFYHYGTSLELYMIDENGNLSVSSLGMDIEKGDRPQALVPAGTVFCGIPRERDRFSLVSTMVAPAFEYDDFELFQTREVCEMFPHLRGTLEGLLPDED
ncbi:MAG: cupin domain-containing protein [Marinilabilia sp.]